MEQMKRYLKKFRFDRNLFLSVCKQVDFDGRGGEDFRAVKSLDVYLGLNSIDCYVGPTGARYYGCKYSEKLADNFVHFIREDFKDNTWKSKLENTYWIKLIEVNNWSQITISINPDETIHVFFSGNVVGDKRQIRKQVVCNLIEHWKEKGFVHE